MRPLRIAAALLMPILVGLAYAPLHKGWLVQWFGCACQGKRGFSASTLSFLVHGGAAVWGALLLWRAAVSLPLRQRINSFSLGFIFLGSTWVYLWLRDCAA